MSGSIDKVTFTEIMAYHAYTVCPSAVYIKAEYNEHADTLLIKVQTVYAGTRQVLLTNIDTTPIYALQRFVERQIKGV